MQTEDSFIEIVIPDEELPTDELRRIKVVSIPVLASEEKERIMNTLAKINEFLASPISDKINYTLDALDAMRQDIEFLRTSARTEETGYRIEEVSKHIERMVETLDVVSSSIKRLETLPAPAEGVDMAVAAEVADQMNRSRLRMEETTRGLEALAVSINSARREISDAREFLAGSREREYDILERLNAAEEKLGASAENAADVMQNILDTLEDNSKKITTAEGRMSRLSESFESGLKLLDEGVASLAAAHSRMDGNASQLGGAAADVDAAAQRIESAEDAIKNAAGSLDALRSAADERITSAVALVEEKAGHLRSAVSALHELREAMDIRVSVLDEANARIDKLRDAIETRLDDVEATRNAIESASAAIELHSDSLPSFASSAERSAELLASAEPRIQAAVSTMQEASRNTSELTKTLIDTANAIDRRTDDILNVMLSKAREVGASTERMSAVVKQNEKIGESLEDLVASSKEHIQSIENAAISVADLHSDISGARKNISKATSSLKKASSRIVTRDLAEKQLVPELKKLNAHLAKYDEVETLVRITDARKRLRRARLPKTLAAKRKTLERSLLSIEDEMADILIITSLRRMKMNVTSLKQATGIPDARLRARLKKLLAGGIVAKERLGRYFVYALK